MTIAKGRSATLSAKTMLARLVKQGVTKWAIKKALGVSWETVNTWSKGHGIPAPENFAALTEFYRERKTR